MSQEYVAIVTDRGAHHVNAQGGPQRPLSLRQREEIQELLRKGELRTERYEKPDRLFRRLQSSASGDGLHPRSRRWPAPEEQAIYDNLRQQAIVNIEESGQKGAILALAEITRLRQAACNPLLINSKLNIASSKTRAFLDLVEQLRSSGHRALVFSQFTSHLTLIREALDSLTPSPSLKERGVYTSTAEESRAKSNHSPLLGRAAGGEALYLYLDGSTPPQERNRLVREFQTGDMPLFLISLKAGGLGLNLTAADFVIHLDPWWNPAIEDQASDRAHRIGQERPVTVYRLIAVGTIEEKIIRLHQNKRCMADALPQDADISTSLSTDDIIRLLRESVDDIA